MRFPKTLESIQPFLDLKPMAIHEFSRRKFLRGVGATMALPLGGVGLAVTGCRSSGTHSASTGAIQPGPSSHGGTHGHAVNLPPDAIIDTHIHLVHGNPDLKPIPE